MCYAHGQSLSILVPHLMEATKNMACVNEKNIACNTVNKGCCSHRAITLQLPATVSPEETQD